MPALIKREIIVVKNTFCTRYPSNRSRRLIVRFRNPQVFLHLFWCRWAVWQMTVFEAAIWQRRLSCVFSPVKHKKCMNISNFECEVCLFNRTNTSGRKQIAIVCASSFTQKIPIRNGLHRTYSYLLRLKLDAIGQLPLSSNCQEENILIAAYGKMYESLWLLCTNNLTCEICIGMRSWS